MMTIRGGVVLTPDEAVRMVEALSNEEARQLAAYARPFEGNPHEFALKTTAWLLARNNRRPD